MAVPGILNDVIGPVMRGPSSSHTAGSYRIGRLACDLAGERPRAIRCTFDPQGSHAATYLPLGADLAFAAGCLDWEMSDPRYFQALEAASESGMPISFVVDPLEHGDHPNDMRIEMELESGPLVVWAKSTGGGIVEVFRIGDQSVSIDGRGTTTLMDGSGIQREARPILFAQPGDPLFGSAAELLVFAEYQSLGLGAAALAYEAALLGKSEAEVAAEMLVRYDVMRQSVVDGLSNESIDMPLTQPSASSILAAEKDGSLALGGILTRVAARAMAVMHVCNSKGVVCAAPTGGAAGVVPAVLNTLESERGLQEEAIQRALFAAGAVGLIVAKRATFAAEVAGCQVEIGVAGAMAAAAVVEAAGGTTRQALDAASICLQNTMGSVCDPVGGGCEIPCHTRNAVAAANAFICADLVMGGYQNPISLDDAIDASYAVGRCLPRELRCTALGGIAATPSAHKVVGE